jgi:hypothetical protein
MLAEENLDKKLLERGERINLTTKNKEQKSHREEFSTAVVKTFF